ncbi:RagB/SusD family nutrient uptake outer membrane protein [Hymenobacter ginsengisoli]|uniref:RagB/SusD family nutrient uptake outer membrane protein n=1 Tax=Hymenobacter ginsengisoli TaxID=1051626 RepID=A0ABP8QQH3_9BACT|nr:MULTISPECIES: RagB/SusD family nutrient uptake outer membrane protein [unclassified Hymenobacter]MBO2032229.1 RagB/SusD family nutrient uptake outer membrane protein [Hymenobacter sp. BT559]
MQLVVKKPLAAVAVALLALGSVSCQNDALNPVPQTQISDKVAFDTPTRVALQVNSLYSFVKTGNFLGGRFQIYNDIRADEFINLTSNAVTGSTVWNHTETETNANDVANCWIYGYQAINQVNVFLAGLDDNASKFVAPVFPGNFATTANQYRGEARLLRALCYYSLLQLYAQPYNKDAGASPGLPLRLLAEKSAANNSLARSPVKDIYAQILADLNFAETNLPATYGDAFTNTTRAHRNTAIALKTRVYLSMSNYTSVITEANKLVPAAAPFVATSGVANGLNSSVAAVFAPPQTTSESILSFPFTANDQPGTQNQLAYYYLPSSLGGNGEYSLNTATGIVADPAFAATDARRTNFIVTTSGGTFLKKYPTGTPYTDNAPVIRYAEVMLNLAEARVRSSNTVDAQALALLNAVRGRSNPAGVYATFTSASDLLNAILLERRIEFLGEGLRNIDLMRTLSPIPAKGIVRAIPTTDPLYIWPIPQAELSANPAMTRN